MRLRRFSDDQCDGDNARQCPSPWSRTEFDLVIGQKIHELDVLDGAGFVVAVDLLLGWPVDVVGDHGHGRVAWCASLLVWLFEFELERRLSERLASITRAIFGKTKMDKYCIVQAGYPTIGNYYKQVKKRPI